MRIVSWNVNGLRGVIKKGTWEGIFETKPDVLCLQETKLGDGVVVEEVERDFEYRMFSHAEKKGYSGTAILSRVEPLRMWAEELAGHPREGRIVVAEFEEYYVVSVYVPNAKSELERLEYRSGEWDVDFREYVRGLREEKEVIVCGDMNVAHEEIDLARPGANRRSAGFTDEERGGFAELLRMGLVDSFREMNPDLEGAYSWWSYRGGARSRNVGWRIDYCLVGEGLRDRVKGTWVFAEVMGSDHCPVGIEID